MRYTIILPNQKEVTIEGDILRFYVSDESLIIYKKAIGEEELIAGIFPKESALVVSDGGEDEKDKRIKELEEKLAECERQRCYHSNDVEKHRGLLIEASERNVEFEKELHKLKSRNLWQRIFNL